MTISLTIPADPEHLAVMRTTVACVAARAHLTLDQVEDVRLAVEEAASVLLAGRPPTIEVAVDPGQVPLEVVVSARTVDPVTLDDSSFSWTILLAMTEHLDAVTDDGVTRLRMRFGAPVSTA